MSGEKMTAPELRPCPFCGGPAVLREFGFDYRVGAKDVRVGCAVAFTPRGDFGDAHGRCPVAPILYSLMAPKGVDIVAAWNRRATPGNAAALRDALNDACFAMFEFLKKQHGGFSDMANALDKGKAALAAPARNCDRFFTAKKAMRAFDEMCEQTQSCRNDKCEVGQFRKTVGGPGCVPGWLFATMKEKGTDNG